MSTKASEMVAGREINKAVCDAFGIEPRISWEALTEDEHASCCTFDSQREGKEWFADYQKRFPEHVAKYHLGTWKIYPNVSGSITDAWVIVEKLRKRFPVVRLGTGDIIGQQWQASFHDHYYEGIIPSGHGEHANAETLPLAICRAALALVESGALKAVETTDE